MPWSFPSRTWTDSSLPPVREKKWTTNHGVSHWRDAAQISCLRADQIAATKSHCDAYLASGTIGCDHAEGSKRTNIAGAGRVMPTPASF